MMNFMKKLFKKPGIVFVGLGGRGFFHWMSDERYLRTAYRLKLGKKLNLENPVGYNEKLQWIKLYDHRPIYPKIVDKYEAKRYVASVIGEQYIIPTLGVWDRFDDIDFDKLPERFVLKCTHDSGGLVICHDKSKLDRQAAKAKIETCLSKNYFWQGREWPYKMVKPRILAEPYMEDSTTHDLRDYKFFTFDGTVKALFIATDRHLKGEEVKFDYFDADFLHLDMRQAHSNAAVMPAKPSCFEEMKQLASKLSVGFPQIRVDFYEVDGHVYFGELTLFHDSGLVPFHPEKWDEIFGSWIELPPKVKIIHAELRTAMRNPNGGHT